MSPEITKLHVRKAFSDADSTDAAVREVAQQLGQPEVSVTALFASPRYDLPHLAAEIHQRFQSPVIGCTTSGEITPKGYAQGALAGFSLASKELDVQPYLIPSLHDLDSVQVERMVDSIHERRSLALRATPEARAFGLLFIDGLSGMEERVIAMLGNALENVPIIGGSAGDDLRFKESFVYHDGKFVSDAAVFTLFMTSLPFRLIKTQHFIPSETRLVISSATPERRLVHEINGGPAAEEYARIIGKSVDELKPVVFSEYPLLLRLGGQYHVRSIQRVNEDGSLTFFCAIDEGLVLRLASGENLVENLRDAFEHVRRGVPNIKLTIGCDCILRRLEVLEKRLEGAVNEILKENHVIGFNTYGEQYQSVHINQTFTGIAIGE
jgi:hypothetical protein